MHYKLKYILRVPTPPTAAQSFGTALHATLKDFNELVVQNPTSLKELRGARKKILELYEKNWMPLGFASKSHEEKTRKQGERYLLEYLKTDLHNLKKPPIGLEQSFIFPLTKELKIGGVIDRVDKTKNGIEIIDYKTTDFTTKDLPSDKDLADDLQLSVYAMAANKVNHPLFSKDPEDVTLSLYFFNKGVKVSTTKTAEQLEKAAQEILKVKEQIEASDFACSGNFWCKDCEYKLFCEGA